VLRVLIGGPDEGRALAGHAGIDGLLFTGSARAGMALHRQFAETPSKILALELGGNNPLVIWDTPDVHAAAVIAVQSAFLSAGQRCTAARRLIVRDGGHEALVGEIGKLVDRIIVGEPHSAPAPFMGPVIDNQAAEQVQEGFLDLMLRGGRPIKHMTRPIPDRPFLSPALIDVTGVPGRPDTEFFGPLLQMIRVPDFEAAIAEANNTRFGLSASLVGGSPEMYDRGMSGNHRPSAYYAADYCAYPVTSSEAEQPRASIGIGLRDA
jgi:succinylglutamic semialdehyde dehydrogenase